MKQTLSEIKYGFERWLEDVAVRDFARRREVLNVCEQSLPYFVREKIDDQFDTLYGLTNPEEVHKLWNKIKTESTLKAINHQEYPVSYTDALHLYESYLRHPKVKGNQTIFEEDSKNPEPEFLTEGELAELHLTKHERNRELRKKCIEIQGWRCKGCGLDFREKYGDIGIDFIEVHHLFPISQTSGKHTVDPTKELVPLCPNCHAMIHRLKGEEMSLEKLRSYINPQLLLSTKNF